MSLADLTPEFVAQIWAEAKEYEALGETIYLPDELEKEAERQQLRAMEHDEREGLIAQFLETLLPEKWDEFDLYRRQEYLRGDDPVKAKGTWKRQFVSNMEIWCECFGKRKEDMQPRDSYAIAAMMLHFPDWEKGGVRTIPIYGRQRVYVRKS